MANNCLVTKLKAVVDNPNLIKLGSIKFNLLSSDFYGFNYYSGYTCDAKSRNNNSVNAEGITSFSMHDFGNLPLNTIIELTNKDKIQSVAVQYIEIDINDLSLSSLTYAQVIGDSCFGNILKLVESSHTTLTELVISSNNIILNDISELFSVMDSQFLICNITGSEKVKGTIDSLLSLSLPSGLLINVSYTGVTATQSAINTLASRNVTVNIDSSQIIG